MLLSFHFRSDKLLSDVCATNFTVHTIHRILVLHFRIFHTHQPTSCHFLTVMSPLNDQLAVH